MISRHAPFVMSSSVSRLYVIITMASSNFSGCPIFSFLVFVLSTSTRACCSSHVICFPRTKSRTARVDYWCPKLTLADNRLHCFGTAPDNAALAEDFQVAVRTIRHYMDSAGNTGRKEGVIHMAANLTALRFRHVIFKVC
jgi:hypothetical protein